jgi:hypothetical protein
MIAVAIALGIVAAGSLFASGWLLAARRGRKLRTELSGDLESVRASAAVLEAEAGKSRTRVTALEHELEHQRGRTEILERELSMARSHARTLEAELEKARQQAAVASKNAAPPAPLAASMDSIRTLLSPMLDRERLVQDLSNLKEIAGPRDLPRLLDAVADAGAFSVVHLCDEAGLPVAVSTNAASSVGVVDHLVTNTSMVLMLADRAKRYGEPRPMGVVVQDESNRMMALRIFDVEGTRFLLTAAARGRSLLPSSLDPVIGKLETMLARRTVAA